MDLKLGWIRDVHHKELNPGELNFQMAWTRVLGRMGVARPVWSTFSKNHGRTPGFWEGIVNNLYRHVVKEVQNPNLAPPLGQNFPNPF